MMRPHCDRCDKLVDDHQTWVEDNSSPLNGSGKPMLGCGVNPIWHISISHGEKMFCRACRIAILGMYINVLSSMKAPSGGHLLDCRWDADAKRYVCADGCEIKKMNETLQGYKVI